MDADEPVAATQTAPGDPLGGSGVLPLGNGQVLLRGHAVIDAAIAVNATIKSLRREAIPPPRRLMILARALNLEAAVARTRQNDVAVDPDQSALCEVDVLMEPALTCREVAAVLNISLRQAQRLAPSLGARRVGGRWLIDHAAVADLASQREAG